MSLDQVLSQRSQLKCELCSHEGALGKMTMGEEESAQSSLLVCNLCRKEISQLSEEPSKHWFCLADSMWSEHSAVKIATFRILSRFRGNTWAQDLLEQMYLTDDERQVAEALVAEDRGEGSGGEITRDSNGVQLLEGDQVTLIKDLDVKGANFTAKRGTLVKGINLTDDPKYIEGRVNGTKIVLVAAFLKKA